MATLCLKGGTVHDPANGIDGEVRDVWIADGRIVASPDAPSARPDRTIDVTGMVVMPGGIDMHCHIAGPKVNAARKLLPENRRDAPVLKRTRLTRSGTTGSIPSTFATGYLYAGLGYTTAVDAAIPPLAARHAHEEFADTPQLDKAFLLLLGNNQFVLRELSRQRPELVKHYVSWVLRATRGYGVKIVNPGGVEAWKSGSGNLRELDASVPGFDTSPREILRGLAAAADELQLPHPVHIHCNNLGMPGNARVTLATMQALEGHRGHLTHIQFQSYGGDPDDQTTFRSGTKELVDYVNAHSNLSVDVGQVMFGSTVSMTGDGPLGYYLHKVTGGKWFSGDLEQEAGCGIVPIVYKNKSFVHALQWAVGMEWFLMMNDPWRLALSTDHPNGAAFLAYPKVIALLMSRSLRDEWLARLPPLARERCTLADLTREYTLNEIAIITRAAPAKLLGLSTKGHLGPGADADVTVYQPDDDRRRMFELPRYVIKGGDVLIDNGELRQVVDGTTHTVLRDHDPASEAVIREWFEQRYTLQFANYPLHEEEIAELALRES